MMNANYEISITKRKGNKVITNERYVTDKERLLDIPSIELKGTYVIVGNKISSILLDTLKEGRTEIDKIRNKEWNQFYDWCMSNSVAHNFEFNRIGGIQLQRALQRYARDKKAIQ